MNLLKFEPGLTRAVGERDDPPVVDIAATVEHDLGNALFDCTLRGERTDLLGTFLIAALIAECRLNAGG